jgi:MFS family permease
MAPALSTIALELDMNSTESVMALSIYLLATAFGPLLIGPLSEIYGRAPILHTSNVWFLVWNIVCGFAKTKETLIAARFMAGFGASAIYALAGGVLGDIWRPEQRGKSLGVYLLIPLLGAAVGETAMDYAILSTLAVLIIRRSHHRWVHGCTHYLAMVSSS